MALNSKEFLTAFKDTNLEGLAEDLQHFVTGPDSVEGILYDFENIIKEHKLAIAKFLKANARLEASKAQTEFGFMKDL